VPFYPNILKVVLFGPQNTGKTTLCEALAKHYNTTYAQEFSRQYAKEHNVLDETTILPIAKGQLELENKAITKAKRLVFFDTNLLETKVYAQLYYNKTEPELETLLSQRIYDLYLLPEVKTPWLNDGIRDLPNHRNEHYNIFKSVLGQKKADFCELFGSFSSRFAQAKQIIDKKLNQREL